MSRAGCWPTPDVSKACWTQAASGLQEQAADVAASILWLGTGGQFDLCPIVYRPCGRCQCGCAEWWFPAVYMENGQWRNGLCGRCRDYCCGVEEIILPSDSYHVSEVNVDGVEMGEGTWRVDDRRRLVRTDGEAWPHCQNMAARPGEQGTFTVVYQQSRLGAAGERAYARLAGEILASWVDTNDCRLPEAISAVTREGITIDFDILGDMASKTGIVEVDLWLKLVNPSGTSNAKSAVFSPDLLMRPAGRVTTQWGA